MLPASELLHLVCLLHLALSVAFICVPTGHPVAWGGVRVYPPLQWAYAGFCCYCIISIIAAGVGNIHHIRAHVDVYYFTLMGSALADVGWLTIFLVFKDSCQTSLFNHPAGSIHAMKVVACTLSSGGPIVCLIVLCAFKVFGMVMASRVSAEIRWKESYDLLPYLKKSVGQLATDAELQQSMPREDALGPLTPIAAPTQRPADTSTPPSLSFRSMGMLGRNSASMPAKSAATSVAGYGSVGSFAMADAGTMAATATMPHVALSVSPTPLALPSARTSAMPATLMGTWQPTVAQEPASVVRTVGPGAVLAASSPPAAPPVPSAASGTQATVATLTGPVPSPRPTPAMPSDTAGAGTLPAMAPPPLARAFSSPPSARSEAGSRTSPVFGSREKAQPAALPEPLGDSSPASIRSSEESTQF